MKRLIRSLCVAVGALAFCAVPALACVNVGVYQDKPASTLPALQKKAGKNVKTVSTYLTVGHALDPKLVTLVRKRGVKLLISWLPDASSFDTKHFGVDSMFVPTGVVVGNVVWSNVRPKT